MKGYVHEITHQGKLFKWKIARPEYTKPPTKKKDAYATFSAQSRLRLLSLMATIDYEKMRPAKFITFGYPDTHLPSKKEECNRQRRDFWRHIENHLGRQVCGLWRLEWIDRKSGEWKGCYCPHFHLMVFDCEGLEKKNVWDFWGRAVGNPPYVEVDCQDMTNEKQCGLYVGKYCAKSASLLDNVLNLSKWFPGRCWGKHRIERIKRHPKSVYRLCTSDFLDGLWEYGTETLQKKNVYENESFTLLGEKAVEMHEILREFMVDPDWTE